VEKLARKYMNLVEETNCRKWTKITTD
jgi:hypothetical protein